MQKCLQFTLKIFYFTLFCCCCCYYRCCCSLVLLLFSVGKQYISSEITQNTYLCWFSKSQTLISVALETIKNVSVNYVSKIRVPNTFLPLTHADDSHDSRLVWLIPYTHSHRRAQTHIIYMHRRHSLYKHRIPIRDSIFNAWIIKIPNTTFRLSRTLYFSFSLIHFLARFARTLSPSIRKAARRMSKWVCFWIYVSYTIFDSLHKLRLMVSHLHVYKGLLRCCCCFCCVCHAEKLSFILAYTRTECLLLQNGKIGCRWRNFS